LNLKDTKVGWVEEDQKKGEAGGENRNKKSRLCVGETPPSLDVGEAYIKYKE